MEITVKAGQNSQRRFYSLPPQPTWIDAGVDLDGLEDRGEIMEAAKLNWDAQHVPLFIAEDPNAENPKLLKLDDKVAIVKKTDGAYLGTVGRRHEIVQPRELFDMADMLAGEHGVTIRRAGAYKGGRIFWILAEQSDPIKVGNEQGNKYILLTSAVDGSRSLSLVPTLEMVWCGNQLDAIHRDHTVARFRHTRSIRDKIESVSKMYRSSEIGLAHLTDLLNKLASKKIGDGQAKKFLQRVAREQGGSPESIEAQRNLLIERYLNGPGQDKRPNSAWKALCAVTDTVDHVVRPGHIERQSQAKMERLMFSATFGSGRALKQKALSIAREMFLPAAA